MWRAYLIEIMTGLVGAEIEMSTNGRYDITLNAVSHATVTVQKSSLTHIPSRWLRPWAHGVLLTFESEHEPETPILAGPFTASPDEFPDSLSFPVSDIRAIFEYRFASAEDFGINASAQRASTLSYSNTSLAFIAQDLVRKGMGKKAGHLPIRFANEIPRGQGGGHERTYHGYDLANNNIDKRLRELSDVIGGPDIMFRPEWVDPNSHQYIRWALHTGTHGYPVIPQNWTMVIDASSQRSQVSELTMNVDSSHYATRFYATGDGEGTGVRMAIRENDRLYADQHPLLEATQAWPSVSEAATLGAYASAGVDIRPYIELRATIDASDVRSPFGRWHVGDKAIVKPGPWHHIPDVERGLRILRSSGDFDSPHTTLYFQEDQW